MVFFFMKADDKPNFDLRLNEVERKAAETFFPEWKKNVSGLNLIHFVKKKFATYKNFVVLTFCFVSVPKKLS